MQDTKTKFFKNIQDNKIQIDPEYGYSNLVIPDYQKALENIGYLHMYDEENEDSGELLKDVYKESYDTLQKSHR